MNRHLQDAILRAYRVVLRTGLLATPWGYYIFERGYDLYKAGLEASSLRHVRPLVRTGSTVVDVGAHVGFFTQRFAAWVGEVGHVIALEPEPINYDRLCRRMQRTGLSPRVATLNAAAAEAPGDYFLRVDPLHPGDHQLAPMGLPVPGVTLDGLLAPRGWPPVSLVKLDVQGAEARVLLGAEETLGRLRPALLVEVDDARLRRQGSSARKLFDFLEARGFAAHHLTRSGFSDELVCSAAVDVAGSDGQYADFVFTASSGRLQ